MDMGITTAAAYTFLFQMLENYQTRKLTNQVDALNAVAGMLRRVATSAKTKMVQGLPTSIFPLALLFLHTDRRAPRRWKQCPSWSWCGWIGATTWYPFDRLDLLSSAEENDYNEDKPLEKALAHYWPTYRIKEGSRTTETIWSPSTTHNDGAINDLLNSFQALGTGTHRNLESDIAGPETATLPIQGDARLRQYPLLIFHTMTMHYRLKTVPEGGDEEDYDLDAERPSFQEYTSRTYEISGRDDEDCGTLFADKKLLLEDDNVVKFVILGECHGIEYPLEFDLYCEEVSEEPVLWVMLIRLIDGVWERRGVGQILRESIACSFAPGPRWEEIVLG